jgi:hypothetical protein
MSLLTSRSPKDISHRVIPAGQNGAEPLREMKLWVFDERQPSKKDGTLSMNFESVLPPAPWIQLFSEIPPVCTGQSKANGWRPAKTFRKGSRLLSEDVLRPRQVCRGATLPHPFYSPCHCPNGEIGQPGFLMIWATPRFVQDVTPSYGIFRQLIDPLVVLLARSIGQVVAAPASENLLSGRQIELLDAPAALLSVVHDRAAKPKTDASGISWGRGDRDYVLLHELHPTWEILGQQRVDQDCQSLDLTSSNPIAEHCLHYSL